MIHASDRETAAPSSKSPAPPRWRLVAVGSVLAVAVCYLVFIGIHCSPYAGPSDASGYMNVARLLTEGDLITSVPRIEGLTAPAWDPLQQQPLGFHVDSVDGTMVPTYPVGFPLHLVLASLVVGLDAATIPVNLLLVLGGAGLMVGVGRHFGLSWGWALGGAAVLWGCPLFAMYALQPMSDMPATVWVLAAIWCSLRARKTWAWGFAAGAAIAVAVLVRPSNLLVLLPVAAVLGGRGRAWLSVLAGGAPGAVFLAWYNHTLYGSIMETGYGSVGGLFGAAHVPRNALHFLVWVTLLLSPVVMLAALGLPWLEQRARLLQRLVVVWVAAFVGFYLFYFHAGETWWYLRFILPAFPAMILAGAVVLHRTVARISAPRMRNGVAVGLLVFVLGWEGILARHLRIDLVKRADQGYVEAADWAKAHLPAEAILLQMQASGAFTYYTNFTLVRWDMLSADTSWRRLQEAARGAGRPIYALLFEFEEERAMPKTIPGKWELVNRVNRVGVWRLANQP